MVLENGVEAWSFSSTQYVKAAGENVNSHICKQGVWSMPSNYSILLTTSYRTDLDVTPEFGPADASYYMSLIGIR